VSLFPFLHAARAQGAPPLAEGSEDLARDEASTDKEDVEPPGGYASARPGVGLVAALGLHTGAALGTRLGLGDVGLELGAGVMPLIAITPRRNAFGTSAQGAAEIYWTPWHPMKKSAIGMKGGYRYNSALHHGFSVAICYLATLNETLAIEGLAGASIFPGSEERLEDELRVTNVIYGSSAQWFEYGFELVWYPF
jgi:hypothetical protein